MTNKFMTDAARLIACLLAVMILIGAGAGSVTRAFAADTVDLDEPCSLTVYPCGADASFKDDVDSAVIILDMYKIASAEEIAGIDSYNYSMVENYSSLETLLETARTSGGREKFNEFAQKAAEIIKNGADSLIKTTVTKAAGDESVDITGIETGLYLLVPHTDSSGYWEGTGTEDDPYVTRVYSDTSNYYYLPLLVSLPHKADVIPTDDPVMTSDDYPWVYDLSVYIKPSSERMADAEILVSKSLIGRDWREGDSFTFTLAAIDGAPMPENSEVTATGPEAVSFGCIRYEKTGVFSYTIVEKAPEKPNNITYDTSLHNVVVTVTKGADNNLKAEVKYDDSDDLTITNIYKSDGLIKLEALKILRGGILLRGAFTFDLLDENGELIERVGNEVGGRIEFTPITVDGSVFTESGETVVRTYTVRENVPFILFRVPGVTYDTRSYTATVMLTDKGDGTIDTSVIWTLNGRTVPKAEFVNTYSRNPKTGDSPQLIWQSALMVLAILIAVTTLILILRKRRGKK